MKQFMPAHGEIPEILIEVTKNLKNDPERFPPGRHKTGLSWLDRVFTESFRDIQERCARKERRAERERRAHPPIKIPVSSLLCASSPSPNLGAEKRKRIESVSEEMNGGFPQLSSLPAPSAAMRRHFSWAPCHECQKRKQKCSWVGTNEFRVRACDACRERKVACRVYGAFGRVGTPAQTPPQPLSGPFYKGEPLQFPKDNARGGFPK
ncbi:hypothetical protein BDZ89DRAFT_1046072 [Hymenopellis radicata]|nr:hypothetical protein BDZ89DRAFT_1046072 [Hymenopellis radicata]